MVKQFKEGSKALFEELKLLMDEIFGVGKKVEDFTLTDKQRKIKELCEEKARKIQEKLDRRKNGGYLPGSDEEVFRKVQKGSGGGQRYKRSTLRQIAKEIEKKYADIGLKVEIVTKRSHPERYKRWTSYPNDVLASCRTHEIPPVMFLRDDATELTIQHEMWHIDDFKKLGFKEYHNTPNWQLEELVWERVWKQKHRWTTEEIIDSYEYYKTVCGKQGANFKSVNELEKLLK